MYYWPPAKKKGDGRQAPLRLRLIRVRGRRCRHDVRLATNVLDRGRLLAAWAGRFYRWLWESEGPFRTYKRTPAKVKLHSRTVRLVHREAEGSLLATQLLLRAGGRGAAPPDAGRGCRDGVRPAAGAAGDPRRIAGGAAAAAAAVRPASGGGATRAAAAERCEGETAVAAADAPQAAQTAATPHAWGSRKSPDFTA